MSIVVEIISTDTAETYNNRTARGISRGFVRPIPKNAKVTTFAKIVISDAPIVSVGKRRSEKRKLEEIMLGTAQFEQFLHVVEICKTGNPHTYTKEHQKEFRNIWKGMGKDIASVYWVIDVLVRKRILLPCANGYKIYKDRVSNIVLRECNKRKKKTGRAWSIEEGLHALFDDEEFDLGEEPTMG